MEVAESVLASIASTAERALAAMIGYAPTLLSALLVLGLGFIVARLVRSAARKALSGTNRFVNRLILRDTAADAGLSPAMTAGLSEVLFWAVMFVTAAIAARIAEVPAISGWLDQIAAWLPNLLVGVAIIVISYLVSVVIGQQVSASARNAQSSQSALIGRLAQSVIFASGLIIGLDQAGVNVTLLTALLVASVGAIFVGFSIAFGLGAKTYVSNLIGARTARQKLRPGIALRIAGVEGELLEITSTQIALETKDGRTPHTRPLHRRERLCDPLQSAGRRRR
jgi:hypothetical protein